MSDLISREFLQTAIHNFFYGLNHTPTEEDIQRYIEVAPSVENKGEWIPVTERLPEKDTKVYLACCDDGYVSAIMYSGGKWLIAGSSIIAWMPLPDKYDVLHEKNIQAYMSEFGVSREEAEKDLIVPESDLGDIPTNRDKIKSMATGELGLFLEDLTHFDDEGYQWKSNLMPLLPFEDWTDWLSRPAIFREED